MSYLYNVSILERQYEHKVLGYVGFGKHYVLDSGNNCRNRLVRCITIAYSKHYTSGVVRRIRHPRSGDGD